MMTQEIKRIVNADVLAVGGSGAGITAAIYASRQGMNVALVSKGKIGYSGNAIMAGGGFGVDGESGKEILHLDYANPEFTRKRLYDCIVKESFFLSDQNMVRQYVEEGPIVVNDYLGWAERSGQDFFCCPPANWIASGLSFTKALIQGLKEADNIETFEDTVIVEVLTEEGKVCGAVGIDVYSGEAILFRVKAIIIGTGGYMPFSMNNTVTDMTGDGPAMAYRAGARLTDMEFILAFPTAVVPKEMKGSIYPYIFEYNMRNLKYVIRDKNGDPLPMPEEVIRLSRGGKLSKLVTSYYFGNAADQGLAGPNGGFFYDYSENSQKEKEDAFKIYYDRFDRWHKHGYYKGESLKEITRMIMDNEPLEVGIGAEYCMGGVEINEKMETGIDGLYVAGEAGSGVFGACRVGDGLVEMMCQGMRAGISAAEYARDGELVPLNEMQLEKQLDKIFGLFGHSGGMNALELYQQIQEACDKGFGLIRNEEGLQKALTRIEELKEAWKNVTLKSKSRAYNLEWLDALQAENLLTCCEAGIRAALLRKESRGCHMRKDFQEVDHDRYLVKYVHYREDDAMKTVVRKPVVETMALPTGKVSSVIDYFLDPALEYKR
ncbi:MAG: FAD-binding protein [Clostridiales bacterium]|nr:FAD-binding protein [Clostridiales bacterium]